MSLLRAAALALIAPSAQSLQNGLALTPPRGFSTWQQWPDPGPDGTVAGASGHSISEETSRRYMNGIVSAGLNKLNYTYFIVDEPCFIGRDASGALLENKTTWPCAPTLPPSGSSADCVGLGLTARARAVPVQERAQVVRGGAALPRHEAWHLSAPPPPDSRPQVPPRSGRR